MKMIPTTGSERGTLQLPRPGFAGSISSDGEEVAFLASESCSTSLENKEEYGDVCQRTRRRSTALIVATLAMGAILAAVLYLQATSSASDRFGMQATRASEDAHLVRLDQQMHVAQLDSDWRMFDETCAGTFHNVDYKNTKILKQVPGVSQDKDCLYKCLMDEFCAVWTWIDVPGVEGLSHVCTLQAARHGKPVVPQRRFGALAGVRAGVPCDSSGVGRLTGPVDGSGRPVSRISSRHGLCLGAGVDPDTGEIKMTSCSASGAHLNWTYYESTGLLKNHQGHCLASTNIQTPFSSLTTVHCNQANWTQQWSHDTSGILKNWRGLCVTALEERDGGSVSTQPCDVSDKSQLWTLGGQTATAEQGKDTDTITILQPDVDSITLFCFSLMVPDSYEQKLLAMQFKARVSIFVCDAFTVYSNATRVVSQGLTTSEVDSNLTCTKGGEFGTVLNLHIFLSIWDQVVKDGLYLEHDWTVKVDPDAVFFAQRLKGILRNYEESGNGVYMNNCKFGLHGPVEALSRRAVKTWSQGWPWCQAHFRQRCHGDCLWGEDMFIDQCLSKVLGVSRKNDFRLLVEDHCDAPSGWQSCRDTSKATFHPFKNLSAYWHCLHNAGVNVPIQTRVTVPIQAGENTHTGVTSTLAQVSFSPPSTALETTARATTAQPSSSTTPEIALR